MTTEFSAIADVEGYCGKSGSCFGIYAVIPSFSRVVAPNSPMHLKT
jgi:hypothetical protein